MMGWQWHQLDHIHRQSIEGTYESYEELLLLGGGVA